MRKYIGDMDETGLAARHIWSGLRRYSAAPTINGIPSYKQVARCVKQLRAKHGERNSVDSIKTLGREFPLFSGIDADQGFIFGSTVDDRGFSRVGKGEGHDSLVLGVTTLRLLEKAKTIQKSNMYTLFHIDATFKQSEIGYPVIICGFSDRARKYRLAAMFVVSRMTHIEYAAVLSALLQVYQTLFSIHPKINAVLGDAEDAQCNALQSTAQFQDAKFMMCFIHVLYNVRKRTRQLADFHGAMAYKGIIAMHYLASLLEYYHIRDTILAQWRMIPQLILFADYFEKQWINGRFWRWQAFHTPTGFATTNNPCETFNASVKRHVMRKMFDTKRLLPKISRICEDVTADNLKPTVSCGGPPSTLVNMARKRVHSTLIVLFETHDPQVVRNLQLKTFNGESRRISDAANQAFSRVITSKTTGQLDERLGRRQRHKASTLLSNAMKWSMYMAH